MNQKDSINNKLNNMEISLPELRIIQRDLLYISNLPLKFLNQNDLLKSNQFFGQFGPIKKIVTNIMKDTINAYITFESVLDCEKAIKETDETLVSFDSVVNKIRSTYGTTKYCTFYLKNLKCQNMDCMYLHKQGEFYDVLTRDMIKYYTINQPNNNLNKKNIVFHTFNSKNKNTIFLGKYNSEEIINTSNKKLLIKELINFDFEPISQITSNKYLFSPKK